MSRRRLDAELVRRRLAESRAAARRMIEEGEVQVEGYPSPKPATMVTGDQSIRVLGEPDRFVSRGGTKLQAALDAFEIPVAERRAIDVGASTGGFTDCLLQSGCASVVALDVGYGQLHWRLRENDRVIVVERTNVRKADPSELGAPFDIVVVDLSFIGIATVAADLAALGDETTDWVLLVKPQFEAGKGQVGRGGIVRDPEIRADAVLRAVAALDAVGLATQAVMASPISGAKGNLEFLLWVRLAPAKMTTEEIRDVVRSA